MPPVVLAASNEKRNNVPNSRAGKTGAASGRNFARIRFCLVTAFALGGSYLDGRYGPPLVGIVIGLAYAVWLIIN